MKILVTGGLGFIFSNFVHYWRAKHPEDRILIVDKGTYAANRDNLKGLSTGEDYRWEPIDIGDIGGPLADCIKGFRPDVIINGAAESHVDNSLSNPYPFINSNILGVTHLLEIIKTHPVRHFIHISTDEVLKHEKPKFIPSYFPSLGGGRYEFMRPVEENALYHTTSPYSASKASAEMVCKAYMEAWKLPITIIRACNNYGPRQHEEKLIPKIIKSALTDKPIPLYGKGEQWRDWLYVEDFCSAIEKIIYESHGQVWHVAANQEKQNIYIVKRILKLLRKPESLIKFVEDRPGHDYSYSLNCNKLHKLGWYPQTNIDKGLEKTIEWVKAKI